jgi:hypothetical protein
MQKFMVHNTPEFNGIAECLNRTLLEHAWAMLHASGLLRSLWGKAVAHACWIKNHSTTRTLDGMMLYEALHSRKPDILQLHEWGCLVWVHNTLGSKLDARMCKGQWVGVDLQSPSGHCIYWPAARSITVKRSIYFCSKSPFQYSMRLEGHLLIITYAYLSILEITQIRCLTLQLRTPCSS